MIINDLYNNNVPVLSEGDVVPFKRAAVSWQKLPKDVLSLANDWFWADFEGGGLQATMDPKGLGSGFANQQKYLGAQLQQRGWAIDIDDEYENIVLKNQQGQTILLPIEDAQDFTGWAQGTNSVSEQGVAEGSSDTVYPNAEVIKSKNGKPVGEIYQDGNSWGCFHYKADRGYDFIDSREEAIEALKDLHQETGRSRPDYTVKGMAEGKDEKIAQLKKDHETAVYWSKNDTNPHKREAARQKAEKIKAHLEKQYKQGVAEGVSLKQKHEDKKRADQNQVRYGKMTQAEFDKKWTRTERPKPTDKKQGVAEGMSDDMAAMAQKKFPNAYISKDGEEVQKPKNWGKRYTPPAAPPADLEKQRRELTAKYPNIDELVRRAELNRDPNYEMADGEAYYAARDAEQNYQKLRQIQRVIQGLNESLQRTQP